MFAAHHRVSGMNSFPVAMQGVSTLRLINLVKVYCTFVYLNYKIVLSVLGFRVHACDF